MKCYSCNAELNNENSSDEHIIPNALGGKWTEKILCKKCNNILGSKYDSVLAKQLEWFSCKVNHSRSYGVVQSVKVKIDGMDVWATPGGNYEGIKCKKIYDNNYQIQSIGKNSIKQTRKKLEEIMLRAAKKYNWDDAKLKEKLDNGYANIEKNMKQQNNPIVYFSSQFGGKEALLSIIKIAVNFTIAKGVPVKYLEQSIKTIKEKQNDYTSFSNLFYPSNIFPKGSIYHTLILVGDSETGNLYCLISLYGVFNAFVLLTKNYSGKNILYTYCYDIWNEKEFAYTPQRVLNLQEVNCALSTNEDDWKQNMQKMKEAYEEFLRFFVLEPDFQDKFTKLLFDSIDQISVFFPFVAKDVFLNHLQNKLIQGKHSILKNKILKDKNIATIIQDMNVDILYNYYMDRKSIFETLSLLSQISIDKISIGKKDDLKNIDCLVECLSEYTERLYKDSPLYIKMKNFISDKDTLIPLLNASIIPILNKYTSLL